MTGADDEVDALRPFSIKDDVPEASATWMAATMAMELALARAGVEPQRTWVTQGSQDWAAGGARWMREHAQLLTP